MFQWNVVNRDVKRSGNSLQFAGLLSPARTKNLNKKLYEVFILPNWPTFL